MSSSQAGPSNYQYASPSPHMGPPRAPQASESGFDIFEWYPHYKNCHKYFLDFGQYSEGVKGVAAHLNILLPHQKEVNTIVSSRSSSPRHTPSPFQVPQHMRQAPEIDSSNGGTGGPQSILLIPYIRRLVATGFDTPQILRGFFGDHWVEGIGNTHEVERRNYLFAAKSESWHQVKRDYDMNAVETIPYLKPLQRIDEAEIRRAEEQWSDWLAMQDWMIGPRAPQAQAQAQERGRRRPHGPRHNNNNNDDAGIGAEDQDELMELAPQQPSSAVRIKREPRE